MIYSDLLQKKFSTHTSECKDVITGANMSELHLLALVLIRCTV